jgi:hypothetical protein
MVRPREIVKRNDSQGAVALHGDGVPLHRLSLKISSFTHGVNTIVVLFVRRIRHGGTEKGA